MTKAEIVNLITKKTGTDKNTVKIVVDAFFDVIAEALKKGGKIELAELGCFFTDKRKFTLNTDKLDNLKRNHVVVNVNVNV